MFLLCLVNDETSEEIKLGYYGTVEQAVNAGERYISDYRVYEVKLVVDKAYWQQERKRERENNENLLQ